MQSMNPDVGNVAMRRRRFETQNCDDKGVIVVASAWLVLYGLIFSGFVVKEAVDVVASLY
jgi:hypothetical protein